MRQLSTSLFVRAGQIISATTWNQLVAFLAGIRLMPGDHTRLQCTPDGTLITFDAPRQLWNHPFKSTLLADGGGARIRLGLLNGKVPKIDDAPLDDEENILTWREPRLDDDDRGWIAIEAQLGEFWEVESASIVQVAGLDTEDGEAPEAPAVGYAGGGTLTLPGRRARWPLAMLRKRESGQLALFQVTHFHLQHRVKAASGADEGRHFFFAAA